MLAVAALVDSEVPAKSYSTLEDSSHGSVQVLDDI